MLTASIVIYDSPLAQVEEALRCIVRSGADRVWIVFNGPDGSLFASLRSLASVIGQERIEVLCCANRGFGAGHNIAMRRALEAGADYHLVANADIRWEGDAVTPQREYMDTHPDTALTSPETVYPDGSPQYTARMLPNPLQLFTRRFLPRLCRRADDRYQLKDLDLSRPVDAPYLLGCFMLLRCEALRQEGLFDERFFMYPEDIDLTRRLHRRWRTLRLPLSRIIHDHARASRTSLRMLRIHLVNMGRYFNKWGWLRDPERKEFNSRLRR